MDSPSPRKRARHRYESHSAQLRSVEAKPLLFSASPTKRTPSTTQHKDDGGEGPRFHATLVHLHQLCLSPSFLAFASDVKDLSASTPLLLHNREVVARSLCGTLGKGGVDGDEEGVKAMLTLFPVLLEDLRGTLEPVYGEMRDALMGVLRRTGKVGVENVQLLLGALDALFRILLVPKETQDMGRVAETWTALSRAMREGKVHVEVRRAVGQAWGTSVLRRMKRVCVGLEEEEDGDVAAWAVVSACKSINNTLHTCTAPLLRSVLSTLSEHKDKETRQKTMKLIRRVLTALAHHVSSAQAYDPVMSVLLPDLDSSSGENLDADVLQIPLSVRQGARVSEKYLTTILHKTLSLVSPSPSSPPNALPLTYTLPLILAPHPPTSQSALKSLLTALFSPQLAGALAHLPFSAAHFRGLVLPLLFRASSKDPEAYASVLGRIVLAGKVREGEGDVVWRERVGGWCLQVLEEDGGEEEKTKDVLVLLPLVLSKTQMHEKALPLVRTHLDTLLLPSSSPPKSTQLASTLLTFLSTHTPSTPSSVPNFPGTTGVGTGPPPTRPTHHRTKSRTSLGGGARGSADLGSRPGTPVTGSFSFPPVSIPEARNARSKEDEERREQIARWTRAVVSDAELAGEPGVLGGLASLAVDGFDISTADLYTPHVKAALGSHVRAARMAALKLLSASASSASGGTGPAALGSSTSTLPGTGSPINVLREAIKRCLAAETAPLDVHGVRERVLRVGRVPGVFSSSSSSSSLSLSLSRADEEGLGLAVEVCTMWLVAQLKVGLRPVWSPVMGALEVLVAGESESGGRGERVWGVVWSEVRGGLVAEVEGVVEGEDGEEEEVMGRGRKRKSGDDDDEEEASGEEEQGQEQEPEQEHEQEQERTWRDPSMRKVRDISRVWGSGVPPPTPTTTPSEKKEKFDLRTYQIQLVALLGELQSGTGCVERYAREVGEVVLSLFSSTENTQTQTGRPPAHIVPGLLGLFSKFRKPPPHQDQMNEWFMRELASRERDVQAKALECVFIFDARLGRERGRKDMMRGVLDRVRGRDVLVEVSSFGSLGDGDSEEQGQEEEEEEEGIWARLLYGVLMREGERWRGAVMRVVAALGEGGVGVLVALMMPFSSRSSFEAGENGEEYVPAKIDLDERGAGTGLEKRALGYLNFLEDVLDSLGARTVGWWPELLGAVVDILAAVCVRDEPEDATGGSGIGLGTGKGKGRKQMKMLALRRLAQFLSVSVSVPAEEEAFDVRPYVSAAIRVVERMEALQSQTTNPSALLVFLRAVAARADTVALLVESSGSEGGDEREGEVPLVQIYRLLARKGVGGQVHAVVMDVVEDVLVHAEVDERIRERVLRPYVGVLVEGLAGLVGGSPTSSSSNSGAGSAGTNTNTNTNAPLLARSIALLSRLASYCAEDKSRTRTRELVKLLLGLVKRPSRVVGGEGVKVDMLRTVGGLLDAALSSDEDGDEEKEKEEVYVKAFDVMSGLFSSLRSRVARVALVSAFEALAGARGEDEALGEVVRLVAALNAYSPKRIEEPDWERRLGAFAEINGRGHEQDVGAGEGKGKGWKVDRAELWKPVLFTMLSFVQDPDELAIRSSAGETMRGFVDLCSSSSQDLDAVFLRVLYPGIKSGLRSRNEHVRAELLSVLGHAVGSVELSGRVTTLREMRALVAKGRGEEEASFFGNVLHLQVHRRQRALRRLGELCAAEEKGEGEEKMRGSTINDVFVPLVAHFVVPPSGQGVDHHLVTDAIQCLGKMSRRLGWREYVGLVQRYLGYARKRDEGERVYVRTVVALLENFAFGMEEEVVVDDEGDGEDDGGEDEGREERVVVESERNEAAVKGVTEAVNLRLLPTLLNHLETHDVETDDTARIPLAIGIASLAKHLPATVRKAQVTKLLVVLSQILRSKSLETRDLVRESMCKIVVSLGIEYAPVALAEMRRALMRGPQLHVLAYTAHTLLVHLSENMAGVKLDACVSDAAHVSAEALFGESGKNVQAEGFKTKVREVKASSAKALDSFALLAKHVSASSVTALLAPIKSIMHETESVKVMHVVDDVLKRTAGGLNSSALVTPDELLTLCHTLITQNSEFLKQVSPTKTASGRATGPANDDAIVKVKRNDASAVDHYANNSFRFVVFGLDLLSTALRRSRFDFQDTAVISKLEAMVVAVGNTLYSTSAEVLLVALKCASSLSKCPLNSLQKNLPIYVRQSIDIIRRAGNPESDVVQGAFKSLAVILRDGPVIDVKEKDLVYLLEVLGPDLEEPTRQASVFSMLRAIVSRKFVVPEIYDMMQTVSEVMVTSQSPQVQEMCRGVLLQFLLDYPQGKGRLKNQMTFLAKNLSYTFESGRRSVLELLAAVMAKFQERLVREYADLLFVALVMVLANDDSSKCREMAGELVKVLFSKLDEDGQRKTMAHLHSWVSKEAQPSLVRMSIQVYGLVIDVKKDETPLMSTIIGDVQAALMRRALSSDSDEMTDSSGSWEVPYQALVLISKAVAIFPDLCGTMPSEVIVGYLLHPHSWVRTASCRLLGTLYASSPVARPRTDSDAKDIRSVAGMMEIARKLCMQLKSEYLDDGFSMQIVKNLFYIGKCFCLVQVDGEAQRISAPDEAGDEGDPEETNPLPWLFSKLSYQIKSAHIERVNRPNNRANWYLQPLSIFRWFAAMVNYMEPSRVDHFLVHILSPLQRFSDDTVIRDAKMDEIKTTAVELQTLIQSKVGVTAFANIYNQIRQGVLKVQRERKNKRVLQTSTNPELAARKKQQRNSLKKESRKRKSATFAESNGRIKRKKEF